MSLLIEPLNKAACIRNQKERLLLLGEYKKKSQEDYLMIHMGLTKAQLSKASAKAADRRPGLGQSRSSPSLLTEGNVAKHAKATGTKARRRAPSEVSGAQSLASEALPKVQQDPVLAVMMNGPPLFSPALCTRACNALM